MCENAAVLFWKWIYIFTGLKNIAICAAHRFFFRLRYQVYSIQYMLLRKDDYGHYHSSSLEISLFDYYYECPIKVFRFTNNVHAP